MSGTTDEIKRRACEVGQLATELFIMSHAGDQRLNPKAAWHLSREFVAYSENTPEHKETDD